jgi:hypothetical protein
MIAPTSETRNVASDKPSGQQGSDDADHHVEQDALLSVGTHDDAGEPAHDAADDQPNQNAHRTLLPAAKV